MSKEESVDELATSSSLTAEFESAEVLSPSPLVPEPSAPDFDKRESAIECVESVSLDPDAPGQEAEVDQLVEEPKGWSSWGSWGKSLLTTATSTVGHKLSSVREKAGVALGKHHSTSCEEAEEAHEHSGRFPEQQQQEEEPHRGVLSSISSAVQSTGKSVLTGGLDALEFIGKKTMTVLAESDPGFKKTKILMQKTVSLSQMLKEAKEMERGAPSGSSAHYGISFDEFQGLSHLEALEILSTESEGRVQEFLSSLQGEEFEILKKELFAIKEVFITHEEEEGDAVSGENAADGEEFVSVLTELLFELHVAATPDKLNKARIKAHDWVKTLEEARDVAGSVGEELKEKNVISCSAPEEDIKENEKTEQEEQDEHEIKTTSKNSAESVYLWSVNSLAEVTARSIEQLHKVAELILHGQDLEKAACQQAGILVRLTRAMSKEVRCLARKFSHTLLAIGSQKKAEEINPLVDTVMLEGSNSSVYIHNALQLLLPVVQVSHIQTRTRSS